MSATISFPELNEVTVDLWGREYIASPATRALIAKVTALQARIYALDDSQADEMVTLMCEALDLRLKPKGQARKKASELVKEKWEAEAITLHQIFAFMERVGEADRPT